MTRTFKRNDRKLLLIVFVIAELLVAVPFIMQFWGFMITLKEILGGYLIEVMLWSTSCIGFAMLPPDFKCEIALKEEVAEIRFKKKVKTFNREKLEMSEKNENYITITDGKEEIKLPYTDGVLFFLGFLKSKP